MKGHCIRAFVDCYIPGAATVAVAVAGFVFGFFPTDTIGAFDVAAVGFVFGATVAVVVGFVFFSVFADIAAETADDASHFTKIEQAIWNLQWAVTVY